MFFLRNVTSLTPTEVLEYRLGAGGKALGDFILAACGELQGWYNASPLTAPSRRVLTVILAPDGAVRALLTGDPPVAPTELAGVVAAATAVHVPVVIEGPVVFALQYSLVESLAPLFTDRVPIDPLLAEAADALGENATLDNVALALLNPTRH